MNYKIALIRGDGIGPEVVGEAVKVLEQVGKKFGHTFTYTDVLMGGCAIDAVGKTPTVPPRPARPATPSCWARWAVPSGGTPPTRRSAPRPLCSPSGRIWGCMPTCVLPLSVPLWPTPAP